MKRPIHALLLTAATAALLACSDDDGGTKPSPGSSSGESSAASSEELLSSDSEAPAPGICGEKTVKIAPDDERILYEGTWFPEVGPDSAILKRHSDDCMWSPDCFEWNQISKIGYHQMMAGVTMRFKAKADTVYMKWNELWQLDESQRSLPYGAMRFGFYRDGIEEQVVQGESLQRGKIRDGRVLQPERLQRHALDKAQIDGLDVLQSQDPDRSSPEEGEVHSDGASPEG